MEMRVDSICHILRGLSNFPYGEKVKLTLTV
jgi:hypothetical protein